MDTTHFELDTPLKKYKITITEESHARWDLQQLANAPRKPHESPFYKQVSCMMKEADSPKMIWKDPAYLSQWFDPGT